MRCCRDFRQLSGLEQGVAVGYGRRPAKVHVVVIADDVLRLPGTGEHTAVFSLADAAFEAAIT